MIDSTGSGEQVKPRQSNIFLWVSLGTIVVIFAALIVIMWRLGFFEFTGTEPSSNVVAAAIALVGTFIGAAVSVVGILIKHSFDQQTLARQEMEALRNEASKWETEQRMKLEAAVRALQLFSTSEGKNTPEIQRDGALFTLANLGQYKLTLQLVDNLLKKKELNVGTASSLLDLAIRNGNLEEKVQATNVMADLDRREAALPECLLEWVADLPTYVREWASFYIAEIILARPIEEWSEKYPYQKNSLVAALCLAWTEEEIPRLKSDIGAILDMVFNAFPPEVGAHMLFHRRMNIDTIEISNEVKSIKPEGSYAEELAIQLKEWASTGGEKKPKKTRKKSK